MLKSLSIAGDNLFKGNAFCHPQEFPVKKPVFPPANPFGSVTLFDVDFKTFL